MGDERLAQVECLGAAAGRGSSTATREQEPSWGSLPEDQGRRGRGWGDVRPSDIRGGGGTWAQPREGAWHRRLGTRVSRRAAVYRTLCRSPATLQGGAHR
jgi:hypothetical protein